MWLILSVRTCTTNGQCKNIFVHEQYFISVSFFQNNSISVPHRQLLVISSHFAKSRSVLANRVIEGGQRMLIY